MIDTIPTPLVNWYHQHARILPWRSDPTPYKVWVSEIMLQQTRVEAVKPYFTRFIEELPTVKHLADASEQQLLKLWEGLGYYSRVRNMQKAAQTIMTHHDGQLPPSYYDLLQLSGIGPYTAGAVASIAFMIPVPAVDGNVLRVVSRINSDYDNIMLPATQKRVREQLSAIMTDVSPRDFNQALMELGATVCIPNGQPKCDICPLASHCQAHFLGNADELPIKPQKKPRRVEEKTILLLIHDGKVALQQRSEKGLLAKLWEFPNLENHLTSNQIKKLLTAQDWKPHTITNIGTSKHIFTHIEWLMCGYAVALKEMIPNNYTWVTLDEVKNVYPLPNAFIKYTQQLPPFLCFHQTIQQ